MMPTSNDLVIEAEGYPKYLHPFISWDERLRRVSGYASSSFAFEVICTDVSALINLRIKPFQLRATFRIMPCAVIESVPSCMTNIVYPGDILLKVNDEVTLSIQYSI